MKQITTIHARVSNPTYLSILWLLNKYGDMPVRDVVNVFGKSAQQIGYMLGQIEDAGLVSRSKESGTDDGRSRVLSINKDLIPYYMYTLIMINDDPEIKSVQERYEAWIKSYKR